MFNPIYLTVCKRRKALTILLTRMGTVVVCASCEIEYSMSDKRFTMVLSAGDLCRDTVPILCEVYVDTARRS